MAPFTWRGSTYNYSIYGSQKSWIFHEHTSFKSKTSKVEYIIVSIWFCDHLCPTNLQGKPDALSQRPYLAPKEGDPILDQ